jgi:hypothetical protein
MGPQAFPGDTAVTGEGRVCARHMFDALVECDATVTYHLNDGGTRVTALEQTRRLPHRTRCDPIIYFDLAKNECRHMRDRRTVSAPGAPPSIRSKRNSDPEYHQVIDIHGVCATNPSDDRWRHHAWIDVPRKVDAVRPAGS